MKKDYLILAIFICLINVLINLIIINMFFQQKRIAVVDVAKIKKDYVNFIANKYSKSSLQQLYIENFTKEVNKFIIQVSQDNNLIVLPKQAVLSGEDIDLTKELRSNLIK